MSKQIAKGERNREALISAAARLFWQRGYHGTSIADLAKDADFPIGNVYYYFQSKADIALAVSEQFVADTDDMIIEIAALSADPRKRLGALYDRLSASQRSRMLHGCPVAAALRDFREEAPKASAKASEVFAMISAFIASEIGRTGTRPAIALGAGRAAVAEWQGGIVLGSALQEASVVAESARRLARILGVAEPS